MTEFLTGNEWWWRLARTCVQGVLGALVANLDLPVGVCGCCRRSGGCLWSRW